MFTENGIPEIELAEQAKDALSLFIKTSDSWLNEVSYRPDSENGRRFKNRMWNANQVAKQVLARLNDETLFKWALGQKPSTSS